MAGNDGFRRSRVVSRVATGAGADLQLAFIRQFSVAFDAGLEPGEFAVGGALRPAGHRAARGEPDEGLRDAEGPSVIVAQSPWREASRS